MQMCVWVAIKVRVQQCVCVLEVSAYTYVFGACVSIREMQKEGRLKWNEGKRRVPWREKRRDCMSESVRGRNERAQSVGARG